ncbi:MAG: DUF167 domain-containing protein [Acidipila sp.]|nr:DUF167 domain-containing protein [Acidipila sp.]
MLAMQGKDGGIVFSVRVQPRASRNAIEGEWQGMLKVRLTAPPVEGKANDALRRLVAASLNVPLRAVTILSGATARTKRVAVSGTTTEKVRALAASRK